MNEWKNIISKGKLMNFYKKKAERLNEWQFNLINLMDKQRRINQFQFTFFAFFGHFFVWNQF